jgi:multiple sugar transport system permease protein
MDIAQPFLEFLDKVFGPVNAALEPLQGSPMLYTLAWSGLALAFMLVCGLALAWLARLIARLAGKSPLYQAKTFTGYLFASPWIVGFVIFVLGPTLLSLYWSFTNLRIGEPTQWVGFENYANLITDRNFITSLFNSLYITVIGVPLQLASGLAMAMLLNQSLRGRNVFRTIYYLPVLMATSTAVLFTWRLMLNANNGVVNSILRALNVGPGRILIGSFIFLTELSSAAIMALQTGNITIVKKILSMGFPGPERMPLWLGADGLAFLWNKPSVVLIMVWSAGAMMVIYLAALAGVPQSLYDAAKVDGANAWQRFRHVTWPMIAPATFYNLIIGMIATLQIFEASVSLVRDGGQNQSLYFVAYYLWRSTFRFNKVGYGAAMSWALLLIILVLTLIQFRTSGRRVFYHGG